MTVSAAVRPPSPFIPEEWAAEEAALRVRGVKAPGNNIEVRLPGSAERTDANIAAAALRALESDALIPTDKVKVTVSKGWETLHWEVEWASERDDAKRQVILKGTVRS